MLGALTTTASPFAVFHPYFLLSSPLRAHGKLNENSLSHNVQTLATSSPNLSPSAAVLTYITDPGQCPAGSKVTVRVRVLAEVLDEDKVTGSFIGRAFCVEEGKMKVKVEG